MPVTIRELHFVVKVNERDQQARNTTAAGARKKERKASEGALVAECVEQTLAAMKRKNER
ncbi:MAG: DUF5908 family protein [Bacteroidota bacterium]